MLYALVGICLYQIIENSSVHTTHYGLTQYYNISNLYHNTI